MRESGTRYRGNPIIVELRPGFLLVRLKGRRSERYSMDYATLLELGMKLEWRRRSAETHRQKRRH